jgi:methionine aminopeptidase
MKNRHALNPTPRRTEKHSLASKVYKGKKIDKGIAFPTCLSVNSVVGHYCPPADDATALAEGDCVKIDLGAHIDGWIAVGAHTVILSPEPIRGRDADLLAATAACTEAALRVIRPGHKAKELAPVLEKIAASFGCSVVEGVLCHQMKQAVIDGHKTAPNRVAPVEGATPQQQAQAASAAAKEGENEFEEGEAWAVDVVLSTGVGSARVLDEKATTVSICFRGFF